MAGPNGASALLRIRSETISYPLEAADGETTLLAGYKRGPACPISVEIEVEGAWAEWSEDSPSDEQRHAMTPHRYLSTSMRAERLLRRNLLCSVIPGLERAAADVLASDGGPWERILVELGWWQPSDTAEASSDEGEAEAGDSSPSTGSPASPPSLPATTGSRSRTSKR